jgi:RND superfamily putative drug exporter
MTPADNGAGRANTPTGGLASLARLTATHPWRTMSAWLAIVAAIVAASVAFGGNLANNITIPGSDAQKATDLLKDRFPARAGDSAQVVFHSKDGFKSQAAKADIAAAQQAAGKVPGVVAVGDPYAGKAGAISKDGTVATFDVQYGTQASELDETTQIKALENDVRASFNDPSMEVEFGGTVMDSKMVDSHTSEMIGLAAAVVVLLFVLGTAVAMGLPIGIALLSVGVGMSILTLLASLTNFHKITPILMTMIGLGVAIDYTLFILMRFRQALADGMSPVDASVTATATAGRAVIFAGTTVAISISGLFLIGIPFVTKMGLGTALGVGVSVALAVTLLPAVLAKLGHGVDRGRVPFVSADVDSDAVHDTLVARFGRGVTRHPKTSLVLVIALLGVMAFPLLSIRLGTADDGTAAPQTTTRKAYDLLASGFGKGVNGPLLVAVDQRGDDVSGRLAEALQDTPGVAAVAQPLVNDSGDTAQIIVYPTTSPQSTETSDLVNTVRDTVIPKALDGTTAKAYVGGTTASNEDLATMMIDRFPFFLLYVVGITFVLLAMAFRSIVIATKAALTTLLSAAAAFGALVAVFQWGWLIGLIGLDNTGPTASYLPVIVLSILFGLSMDYEVFLASRIREEYVAGGDAHRAIDDGVAAVGRVIIAAALIMGSVFWAFVLTDDRTVKSFGVGLGVAILADALLVRMIVVPAVMQLLGDRAWYMPHWLDRLLPNLTIEPGQEPSEWQDDDDETVLPEAA